ncbi:MAG: tetratricopeptide repeat protein [Rhodobacteraceae bacterium]|nr:tetratricopeptide repeat protein [Paracoccaceae bacterium]
MLWALIRILLFIAIVAGLTLGASYLLEADGGARVTVAGWEYTFGPLESVLAAVVLLVVAWLLLKFFSLCVAILKFLSGAETKLSRFLDRNSERKGYLALAEGMTALASGEGKLAMTKAAKAERFLRKPDLTNLLIAQAAEMTGNTAKATETYKLLIYNEKTRFVGVRGIMRQKLSNGDTQTALKLAETAFKIKPKHEEVQDVLLKLQTRGHDWSGARNTLAAKLKHGALPRDVFARYQAVLALSEAKEVIDGDTSIAHHERAIEANRLSPDLIPAAAMAARVYIAKGKSRYATRILKQAWSVCPHPDLAAAFAEIAPDESPAERIKRFTTLTNLNPDEAETKLLLAELHIAAEDFPAARRALGALAETQPDARSLTIIAAIERGEGADDAVVRGWLAKAVTVPRGPQWVCDNCQHVHSDWAPICSNCEAFDTLSWRTPPAVELFSPTGRQMLPLIVGASEGKMAPEAEPEAVDGVAEPKAILSVAEAETSESELARPTAQN